MLLIQCGEETEDQTKKKPRLLGAVKPSQTHCEYEEAEWVLVFGVYGLSR